MASDPFALRIRQVSKAFPGIRALHDVSLDVRSGDIHALVGGNGSGKSTLLKILAGVYHADRGGSMEVHGMTIAADRTTPAFARMAGLRFVHQDVGIFPTLTVAENVAIRVGFQTKRAARIDQRRLHQRVQELLDHLTIETKPDALAHELAPAERSMLAVGAALWDDRDGERVFVLDEPTASLAAEQSRLLYADMRSRADAGHTVVFVSHRLDEVLALADRATVLRDGEVQGTLRRDELAEPRLVKLIMGRTLARAHRPTRSAGPRVALEARELTGGPLRGVSFALHEGEILGIAGPLGAGRSELLQVLFGARAMSSGSIAVDGVPVRFSEIGDAMRAGIAYVPPDAATGAFPDLSLAENLAAANWARSGNRFSLRRSREERDAMDTIATLSVHASSPRQTMATLSGGDQQKIIVSRWLRRNPRVLLLDQPTRSVDAGARLELHRLVAETVAKGAAAIVVSDDFEELALLADRILVMEHGRVSTELAVTNTDARRIAALALGAPASSA